MQEHYNDGEFWDILWTASSRQDLVLGKDAIRHLGPNLKRCVGDPGGIWPFAGHFRPEWQLELVKHLLPDLTYTDRSRRGCGLPVTAKLNWDLEDVARKFNPA
jgi:hypothetical protein